MKTKVRIGIIVAMLSLSACADDIYPQQGYEANEPVSFQVFYSQLSPYGMWVNYPAYGYVWVPDAAWGFSPYATNGNWIYTNYGWTWHSYYSWGWAPFHYGRWFYDVSYGWMWVPDTTWSPAWVAWRNGGGYCGWAPLGPGVSINVVISGGYTIPREQWVFVRDRDFSNRYIGRHRVDRTQNTSIIAKAPVMRNIREDRRVVYSPGPDRNEIQRVTNKAVTQIEITEGQRPGRDKVRGNQLEIFKPQVDKDLKSDNKRTPDRVYELNELRQQSNEQNLRRQGQMKPEIRTQPNRTQVTPRIKEPRPDLDRRTGPPILKQRKKNN